MLKMFTYGAIAMGILACAETARAPVEAPPPTPTTKPSGSLGTFTLSVDPATRRAVITQSGVATHGNGVHVGAPLIQDTFPNSNPPGSVELVTTLVELPGEGSCGPTENCFEIDLNSFLARPAFQVTLVFDRVSPSRVLANSSAPPAGSGLTSPYGMINFGDVGAGGSSTRSVRVNVSNSDPYIAVMSLWEQDQAGAPANDEPAGAVALTVGPDFPTNAIVGSNVGATASELFDASIPAPGCAAYSGADVWFSVVVPPSGLITLETGLDGASTLTDSALAVYSGAIGSLVLEGCNDDGGVDLHALVELSGRTAGETLFVRVWEFGGGIQDTVQVSAWEQAAPPPPPPPPANDEPNAAVALTVGPDFPTNAIVTTNLGATASELLDPSIPAPGCASYAGNDVWYTVEVPASGNVRLETDLDMGSPLTDTGLAIYSGTIGAFVLEGCDDDNGNGFFSQLDLTGRTVGEVLFVRVWEFGGGGQDGSFQLSAYEPAGPPPPPPPPANDEPVGASVLTPGADFVAGAIVSSNLGATASELLDPSIPAPGCAAYSGGDVWFTVVVPGDGNINLETGPSGVSPVNDTGLAVYSGTIGALALEGCNDDSNAFFSRIDLTGRTAGETLFVRVWAFNNGAAGDFEVSAFSPPP